MKKKTQQNFIYPTIDLILHFLPQKILYDNWIAIKGAPYMVTCRYCDKCRKKEFHRISHQIGTQ